jgi:hypothetical protein
LKNEEIPIIAIGVLRERWCSWYHQDCMDFLTRNLLSNGIRYIKMGVRSTNIYKGRERLADQFMESRASHLLFLDSDEIFAPGTANHLFRLNLPVVTGVVFKRNFPHEPCIYRRYDKDRSMSLAPEMREWFLNNKVQIRPEPRILELPDNVGLVEIDECGTGCLMIRRDVMEAIPKPRFIGMQPVGTDLAFCRRIREAGFPIYADRRVLLGHLEEDAISMAEFMKTKRWILIDDKKNIQDDE